MSSSFLCVCVCTQNDSTLGMTIEDSRRNAESLEQLQQLKSELKQEIRMYQKANFQAEYSANANQQKVDSSVNM